MRTTPPPQLLIANGTLFLAFTVAMWVHVLSWGSNIGLNAFFDRVMFTLFWGILVMGHYLYYRWTHQHAPNIGLGEDTTNDDSDDNPLWEQDTAQKRLSL